MVDNTPPVAVADEYTMDEDTTLVDAPGILKIIPIQKTMSWKRNWLTGCFTGTLVLNWMVNTLLNYYGTITFTAFDGEYCSATRRDDYRE